MKSTLPNGQLVPLEDCYILIPEFNSGGANSTPTKIVMDILPDISDSKSVSYPDENAIGRSMPFKSYQASENRTISWTAHFQVCQEIDKLKIINYLRAIEACTYPKMSNTGGAPYSPPPICRLKCGQILGSKELCAVMKSYSVKFDPSVPWDKSYYLPYKLDVDMQFDVVYDQSALPGAEKILADGV